MGLDDPGVRMNEPICEVCRKQLSRLQFKYCSRECASATRFQATHGHSTNEVRRITPTYKVWQSMKQRCLNPQCAAFPSYGGAGITIHPPWVGSFEMFFAYVGERPSSKHSFDRHPDPHGNYIPGNVRWATKSQQAQNRRNTRLEPHEPEQIRWLRSLGYRQCDVARFFEIDDKMVERIVKGKAWK